MKKIAVSKKLLAFIKKEFQSMVKDQRDLDEQKEAKRPSIKRKDREMKAALRLLDKLKSKYEVLYPNEYKKYRSRCFQRTPEEFLLKGKGKTAFNEFVYLCYCLLKKENPDCHSKDIHSGISRFLNQQKYHKTNGKPYIANDIKRIINYEFEDYSEIYGHVDFVKSCFDLRYQKFCKKSSPG